MTNVTNKGLVFYGMCFLLMPNIFDSLRNNHQKSFESAPTPVLIQNNATHKEDIHFLSQPWTTTPVISPSKYVCQIRLLAIHVAWVWFVETVALWISFLRINVVVCMEQGTKARCLLAITWTYFWSLYFSYVNTHSSSSRSFGLRLFSDDDYSTDSAEHALIH